MKTHSTQRDIAIDRFRGFAVLMMIVLHIWRDFYNLEFLSRLGSHWASNGLTIIEGMQFADVFAPMFLFAVALTYKISFDNRCLKYGEKSTLKHFIKRYVTLIAIGGILRAIESFIFFASHGYAEKPLDFLFFVELLFLILFAVGKGISIIIKNSKMCKLFSTAIFAVLVSVALLCLVSTARDFFVQIFNKESTSFKAWGYWEALQAIGGAGLVTLIFIKSKTLTRFVIASFIFVLYSIFHEIGNHQEIISVYAQQGGFIGIMGQSCIMLYGTVLADLYQKNKPIRYIFLLLFFGVAAFLFLGIIPPTMRSVSPSYILINLFISGTTFLIFKLFDFLNIKVDVLSLLGKNSLIMYLLQYVLIYGSKEIIGYSYIKNASDLFALSFTIIMIMILLLIAYWLNKRKLIIKL